MPRLRHALILLLSTALSACGWFTNESGDIIREDNKNSNNGGNSSEQILDENGGLPDDSRPPKPTAANTLAFYVEATEGMQQATVSQRLWQWLTPSHAYATDAGDQVGNAGIFIGRLDFQGEIISEVDPSSYGVVRGSDNIYTLTFPSGLPQRLDLVVVAQLPNGVQLRHALPGISQSFRVNAASEYAVATVFNSFTSQAELNGLTICAVGDAECDTQKELRLTNWLALMNGIQDFEVSIPENLDFEEALSYLNDELNIRDYAEQFAGTIKEDKLKVVNNGGVTPVMEARGGSYNAIYFAFGWNQADPDGAADGIVFANRSSRVLTDNSGSRLTYSYPNFVFSPTVLGVINNLLVETYPFGRITQTLTPDGFYQIGPPPANNDLVQFVGSTISFLNAEGLMDLARLQVQSVTDQDSDNPTGWLFNPHYTRIYTTRDSDSPDNSDSMVSAFWSTGLKLELAENGNNYQRESIEENQNTFGWLFHSMAAPANTDFTLDPLNGADYIVINLRQRFGSTPNPAINWTSSLDYWSVEGSSILQTQPLPTDSENLNGPDVFNTLSIGRNDDNSPVPLAETRQINPITLLLSNEPDIQYNNRSETFEEKFRGRISVGDWLGMSDPEGNVLSFTHADGSSLAHAIRVRNTGGDIANGDYTLYGNSVAINGDQSLLHNLNGSTLSFENGTITLTLQERRVIADHTEQNVTTFEDSSGEYTLSPQTTNPALGTIRNLLDLSFSDPKEGGINLSLQGASTSGDNLMVLRLQYGDRVGLLYGFREQTLTEQSN